MDMDAEGKFCDERIVSASDRRKELEKRVHDTCMAIKHIFNQKMLANEASVTELTTQIKQKENEIEDGLKTAGELHKQVEALAVFQSNLDQEKYKIQQQIHLIDKQITSKREEFSTMLIYIHIK